MNRTRRVWPHEGPLKSKRHKNPIRNHPHKKTIFLVDCPTPLARPWPTVKKWPTLLSLVGEQTWRATLGRAWAVWLGQPAQPGQPLLSNFPTNFLNKNKKNTPNFSWALWTALVCAPETYTFLKILDFFLISDFLMGVIYIHKFSSYLPQKTPP